MAAFIIKSKYGNYMPKSLKNNNPNRLANPLTLKILKL